MRRDDLERVLTAVSEAAVAPELWGSALDTVADATNATVAHGHVVGEARYQIVMNDRSHALMSDYLHGSWQERNSHMQRGLQLTLRGLQGLVTEHAMFTPEEYARDAFTNELLARHDLWHTAGMRAVSHRGSHFLFNLIRSRKAGVFSADEHADIIWMMSCLKPVLELAVRLKLGTAVGLLDAAARRGEAVALLGSRGDILQANEPFEAMLGTRLMLKGRRLSVRNADDDRRLQALITHCIQPPSTDAAGPIPAFIGPENGRLLITCHAITGVAQDLLALARGILFVEEVSRPKLLSDGSRLRAAFGLSPAETRLAVRLAGGQALRTAAEAEQVTYETARTRLKAIFQKTGVNRQSELVVLVGKLSRPFA